MTRLRFSVLGPLQVRAGARAMELGSDRRRTTLAALLVDADRVVALDALVDRVWGDGVPDNPTSAVHTHVSRLRAALRIVDHDGREAGPTIQTVSPGYRLLVGPDNLDARRFEVLLDQARQQRRTDCRGAREVLGSALGLWYGRAYADIQAQFAQTEASRLDGLRVAAEELAIDCDLALGRHRELVEHIEALIAADPLRESLHAALMLALYRSGRQAEALHRFESVRSLVADELGSDPSRELRDLHAAILRQDPALAAPPAAPFGPAHPLGGPGVAGGTEQAAGPGAAVLPAGPAPLRMVGRDAELARAVHLVRQAWTSDGPVAIAVVGEAGIGKTRLLEETALAAATASPAGVVAWGRCWQHDGAPTLWPWVQVVRAVVELVPRATLDAALLDRGSGVRRLLPELQRHAPALRPGPAEAPWVSLDDSQLHLFDAVTAFLETVAGRHRLLLVLEDMQWADPASRQLTEYLVTHGEGPGPAVLVSVRSPSEDATVPGQELLGNLARSGRIARVPLGGLGVEAVREYVADRTGTQLDDATAHALVERTEGNPFFVGELVRLLVTDADPEPAVAGQVPDTVREVVLRRLHRLPATDLTVLRAAAVVGRSVDLDLLHEISGADLDEVDEAVDRATAGGLLCSDPAGVALHRFTHALVQQTLVEDTGPARRRRLHARIAEALRDRAPSGNERQLESLVYHLVQTGDNAAVDEAVGLSLDLADTAVRQGNHPRAEVVLLRALDLTAALHGPQAPRRELSVRARLCALYDYFYTPAHPPTVAHRRRAVELARGQGRSRDRFTTYSSAAAGALGAADFAGSAGVFEEMLVSAVATDDLVLEAAARQLESNALIQQSRFEDGIAKLDQTLELVARFDEENLAWARIALVNTPLEAAPGWRLIARAMLGGNGSDGTTEADLATTRALTCSTVPAVSANAEGLLAIYFAILDEPGTAHGHAVRAVEQSSTHRNLTVAAYLTAVRAWSDADATAADLIEAMIPLESDTPVLMRPFLRGLVADAHLRAGRLDDALTQHRLALAEANRTGNTFFAPHAHDRLAALLHT